MKGTIYLNGPFQCEWRQGSVGGSRLHLWSADDTKRECELVLFFQSHADEETLIRAMETAHVKAVADEPRPGIFPKAFWRQ